jgi:hypothetical protein
VAVSPEEAMIDARIRTFVAVRDGEDWARWRELAEDAPPFLLPEVLALHAPLVDAEPVVVTAARSGRLAGALPLLLGRGRLRAFRGDHARGFDYCGDPDGLDAIWHTLRRDGRWSDLFLEDVPAGSPLATRLPAIARADRCPAVVAQGSRQRFLALTGFEKRLAGQVREALRASEREAGGLELERIARPTRADFEEALALEALAGGLGAADRRVARVHRAMGRLLGRRGRAHAYFLRAPGRRIGAMLTVEDTRVLYALRVGYDPASAALDPGRLLAWKVAADAEGRGLQELALTVPDPGWPHDWPHETRELVSVRVYRRSLGGLVSYGLRELVNPRLPNPMGDLRTPLRRDCQRGDVLGDHSLLDRVRGRLDAGLGIRSGIRRALARRPPPRDPLGAPSRFAPGDWVRVLEAERIRATLDADSRLRGLKFVPQMWTSCGKVYRVQQHIRRMRDDRGRYRPIARTVLVEGVDCAGDGPEMAGCGRRCPIMYRDEWLEPAAAPRPRPPPASATRFARVRPAEEIEARLDLAGRTDGLTFMPEMARFAGRRFPVLEVIPLVYEHDRYVKTRVPVYILQGLHCSGAAGGASGPCERSCALLWHEDWLVVEPAEAPRVG